MWDELTVNGYLFNTPEDFEEAKKEEESIRYIMSRTDFSNYEQSAKLYKLLKEKKSFHTVIGFDFMHDLYRQLQKLDPETTLEPVKVNDLKDSFVGKRKAITENSIKYNRNELISYYDSKLKSLRIIVFFLAALLIGLFIFTFASDNNPLAEDEVRLQNKYAAWEEELEAREAAVKALEDTLE